MTEAFNANSRQLNLERLRRESFDVLIVGGGINGAGIARDLTLRASYAGVELRVALIEQRHFAGGTSGKNSHLIHGGLRYLKQLQFGLVRESLEERATLLEIAPHLVQPQPFLLPAYGWFARCLYGGGLWLYDALAGNRKIGRHRSLSRAEVLRLEPGLARERLAGGDLFFDCRVESARFVMENIFDAARNGAAVVNYLRAESRVLQNGRLAVVDTLTGRRFEIAARKLVDATGPWGDPGSLRLVRGSHLVFPKLNASENAIAWFENSGRIVFVIPWGSSRELSLVGTTDVDHAGSPDVVRIAADEVQYLRGIVRQLFPATGLEPVSAFSSLRPLVRTAVHSAIRTSREHHIWNSPDRVLHVAGGKYTTYRSMSEEAADLVTREIAPPLASVHVTAGTPLPATEATPRPPAEQIAWAVNHEMAQRLADILFLSTSWGYERRWSADELRVMAETMGKLLGWSAERMAAEVSAVQMASLPLNILNME